MRPSSLLVPLAFATLGCASSNEPDDRAAERIVTRMMNERSVAVAVLGPRELEEDARSGSTITDVLAKRITNMRVTRGGRVGQCPRLILRGMRTITGSTDPDVYVDGARMPDTCILESIPASNIARIEVYSGGQIPRSVSISPGMGGAIIIITKR